MNYQGKMQCRQANELDLVDYLSSIGHQPKKICGNDYWYLSPLRQEQTPSFKVNRKLNVWYDHAIGKGGRMVDFGILYHKVSVKDLLDLLTQKQGGSFSFHQQVFAPDKDKLIMPEQSGKIEILSAEKITEPALVQYLEQRKIPTSIARQFCEEICFELYGQRQLAIGFKNARGGYELRSPKFKGSSSPKEPVWIAQNNTKNKLRSLTVFEGFFNFLSFQMLTQSTLNRIQLTKLQTDFLVLNSLAFFEKSRTKMEAYDDIHLFLDRDAMGIKCAHQALQWSDRYQDKSHIYGHCKDLNDYLIQDQGSRMKQSHRRRPHI